MAVIQDVRATEAVTSDRPATPPECPAAGPTTSGRPIRAIALLIFFGSFVFRFLEPEFHNDHFRLLAQARQILDGELPFRDFVDPGVFLQIHTSAAIQLLFGYRLLGEALLCISLLSAGYALTFVLAAQASRSILIALVLTLFVIVIHPRLYAYDKVFLLVFGLFLCWRYLDRPTTRHLAIAALGTAFAFLYRHDLGVYIGAGAVAMLVVAHWRQGPGRLLRRLAIFGAVGALPLLPFLGFLEANGGAVEYFRSAVEYTQVRGEGRREELAERTSFVIDPSADLLVLQASPPVVSIAPGILQPANAIPWLYHLFVGLPAVAIVVLLARRIRRGPVAERMPSEVPKIITAAALCLAADRILLRDPLDIRLADVAAPTAVIGAWLLGQWIGPWSPRSARLGARRGARSIAWAASRAIAALALVGITWLSIAIVGELPSQVADTGIRFGPRVAAARAAEVLHDVTTSPPIEAWAPADSTGLRALTRYVHECSKPTDRLLVTWFAPDVYYYSGRGFAGGQLFWFASYQTSPREQQRSLDKLRAESVPIIIAKSDGLEGFAKDYRDVYEHIVRNYRMVRDSGFGGQQPYQVLVDRRREPTGTYRRLSLPCFN